MTNFNLPPLPYDYDALAPYMSRETLELHHDKHHKAYVDNANRLIEATELEGADLVDVIKKSYKVNDALFNNAAQHYNHMHFWRWMKPNGGENMKIEEKLEKAIIGAFGGVEGLKEKFLEAANTQFGSGWAWLALRDSKLEILKTSNGENPLIYGALPLLGIDVWEHSYYVDYRNVRANYTRAFWEHLVNWDYVAELYEQATA